MLPPSNESEAKDLIREAKRYYRKAITNFRQDNDFYEGEIQKLVRLPEGFELTIPSTARAIVDEAVDNVMPDEIRFLYHPRNVSKKAEQDADAVRRWLDGLWKHWRRSGSDIDVLRDFLKNLAAHGKAILKVVPDWTLYPVLDDGSEQQLRESGGDKAVAERVAQIKKLRSMYTPIVCRSIDPRCILEDPTIGGRKLWAVETYKANISEVKTMYARWEEDFRGYNNYGSHTIDELWSVTYCDWNGAIHEGQHYIFIDDKLVHQGPNPYGELPYIIKYAGYGREDYEGKPDWKSVGLYTPQVKSLLLAESRRFSQFDAIMAMLAFPIILLPEELDVDAFDTTPGALNPVSDEVLANGDKIFVSAPIPEPAYLQSLQLIGQQIERGSTNPALGGAHVAGVSSAAQMGSYIQQSKLRIAAMETVGQDAVSEASRKALRYVDEVFQDKASVFGPESTTAVETIAPTNIQGHYIVDAEFMPNEELEKERKLALASDAIAKGGLDPYTALEMAGFSNPEELIERRMAYDIMQLEPVKMAIGKEILKAWGVDADLEALKEQIDQGQMQMILQQIMNQMQIGTMRGVGVPGVPGGGPPPPNNGGLPPGAMPPGQNPMAALAQQGRGPMPMPPGAPPAIPQFVPQQVQQ